MSTTNTTQLLKQRVEAAESSKGTSQEHLIELSCKWIGDHLTGSNKPLTVLDYGSGTGSMLRRLLTDFSTHSFYAADLFPCPQELESQVTWIQQDLNEQLNGIDDNSLDLLVSVETIEHLENPRAQFREWARLLKNGGKLWVSTPNCESWLSLGYLLTKGIYSSLSEASYPAHLIGLTAIELQRCANEAGFSDISISYSEHGRIPFTQKGYWQKWAPCSKGKRWSDTVILTANYLQNT